MEKKRVGRPEGKLYAKKVQLLLAEDHIEAINQAMKKGKKWKNMSDFIRYAIVCTASKVVSGQEGQNDKKTLNNSEISSCRKP